MAYLNKAQLMGNVGQAPKITTFDNGDRIANLSLATTRRWTDAQGEQQQKTSWHNLVVSGKLVGVVEKYVGKGDPIYVDGELNYRSYNDNGETKWVTEIRVNNIQLLKPMEQKDTQPAQASRTDGYSSPASRQQPQSQPMNDLPF